MEQSNVKLKLPSANGAVAQPPTRTDDAITMGVVCRQCGGPIYIQIRKGTGLCCTLCEKAHHAHS